MPKEHIAGPYAVVGAGRLGCALAEALVACGRRVTVVYSRSQASAQTLAQRLPNACVVADIAEVPAHAGVVFLAVPDDQLGRVAGALPVGAEHAVVHSSGATELSVLDACAARGAAVGCFHPLQTFPSARAGGAARLSNIAIGIEATGPLADDLAALCVALASRSLPLAGVDRAGYHAGAVFTSNYVVALFAAAERVWQAAGLPKDAARGALAPLAAGAVAALLEAPPSDALTGPIARGDLETVRGQLGALGSDPPRLALYRALARELLDLRRPVDEARREQLARLLADPD